MTCVRLQTLPAGRAGLAGVLCPSAGTGQHGLGTGAERILRCTTVSRSAVTSSMCDRAKPWRSLCITSRPQVPGIGQQRKPYPSAPPRPRSHHLLHQPDAPAHNLFLPHPHCTLRALDVLL